MKGKGGNKINKALNGAEQDYERKRKYLHCLPTRRIEERSIASRMEGLGQLLGATRCGMATGWRLALNRTAVLLI